jgi:hypothetical protein
MEETFQGVVIDEHTHDDNLHDFTVILIQNLLKLYQTW